MFDKDSRLKKCDHKENCGCDVIKKELSDTLKKKSRSKSETRNADEDAKEESEMSIPMSPVEIKMYNAKTLPKRIEKIKKSREKKETAKFYTELDDEPQQSEETVLKIVESTDEKQKMNVDSVDSNSPKKKDSDIIKSILVQSDSSNPNRRLQKPGMCRRTSLEKIEQSSPLSSRKLAEALAAIKIENNIANKSGDEKIKDSPTEEPLYEELLRNVHVPYKFAPPLLKRSQSVSSASSTRETVSEKMQSSTTQINKINDEENDGSECDYVTLTYSDDKLQAVDGVSVKKDASVSCSSDDLKMNRSLTNSENNLDKQKPKSFLYKFMHQKSHDEDATSQRSMSISSRKSLDGGLNLNWKNIIYKTSTNDISLNSVATPPIYRQGSEDMGNRIANVDYADPKTLFPSAGNILINKSSLNQRDSVVSSSTDSIIVDASKYLQQMQQNSDPFSDSYYEDTAESLLENDFRDSAIYSDDSNEKKVDTSLNSDNQIYAIVNKTPMKPAIPPKIAKKPSLLVKPAVPNRSSSYSSIQTSTQANPPIPAKPSNLRSPEIRNAIFSVRKLNTPASPPPPSDQMSPNSWVKQQVQKFQ